MKRQGPLTIKGIMFIVQIGGDIRPEGIFKRKWKGLQRFPFDPFLQQGNCDCSQMTAMMTASLFVGTAGTVKPIDFKFRTIPETLTKPIIAVP
ncbi:MAG: hypothetical protein U9R69_05765 [Thermodesulfobacteriota bacterium]|nr:hypothetical protein [Thermodesulfobacteriota bacterium]